MTRTPRPRWSRRGVMFLIVGIQILILAAIVASQEINRLLDSSLAVDLEIPQAYARKDPFRGASVSGQPALDLEGPNAVLPPERLQPGERVLVFFAVEPGRRPRITEVERRGWGSDPPFTAVRFSIPGTVRRPADTGPFGRDGRGLIARVGKPAVSVELDLPASIPVEDAALDQLVGQSVVWASLRQGFLGHRYLTDVRLGGRGWTEEMRFAYDEIRDRLVVISPKRERFDRGRYSADQLPRSEIFFFDGMGKEVSSVEVAGRLIEGVVNPADGTLWVLMTHESWGHATVQLAQVGEDGRVVRRSPQIAYDRIVGFDAVEGAVWVLAGGPASPLPAPFFVDRMTLGGLQGPRLGPFASRPRTVLARGQQVWVLEPDQHRVTRLDLGGRIEREYGDVNRPTDIAVDAGAPMLVEAAQTQLSKFSLQGQATWRVPRFQGLAWILPEAGTGEGWVGAQGFEDRGGGVFRYEADGKISQVSRAVKPRMTGEWNRQRLGSEAVWAKSRRRLYIREDRAIAILSPDGTLLKRVEGFRYATEKRVRS